MARDIFIKLNRCHYCGRPASTVWDVDLFSCGREGCEALAFAEAKRRQRSGREPAPEKKLATALLSALDTLEYELRLDKDAELVEPREARSIDEREREQTAHLLSELRQLERNHPAPKVTRLRTGGRRPGRRIARERA